MKEPGSYAEAAAVERDGWAADSDDEAEGEGESVKAKANSKPVK